jgi:Spy/CpxP family protein refolding chaperone
VEKQAMSDNRVRIWFSLFVLVVFCVGLAGGVLLGRSIGRRAYFDRSFDRGGAGGPMDFGPGGPGGPGPMGGSRRGGGPPSRLLVDRLASDLDLTADQRTKIEEVLTARRTRLETVQREVRDRFEAEQRSLRDDIRKVLTPEQQEKFDRNEQERGRFGRRGPPR